MPAYLEAATNSGRSRAHIEKRIRTTAGQSGVSGSDIKSMPVPVCCTAEQTEIVRALDGRLKTAAMLEAKINKTLVHADLLRRSILKKAFAGRLVPQDSTDKPASAILDQIKAEQGEARMPTRRTPAL